MYEESVRVPLFISLPGMTAASTVDALSCHMDFAPTLAAAAGLSWPTPLRGRNLLGNAAPHEAVFSFSNIPARGVPKTAAQYTQMVRTPDWKYVHYPSGGEQLFNLKEDPYELSDRVADGAAASVKKELVGRLQTEIAGV
jgi:arylsulfatase